MATCKHPLWQEGPNSSQFLTLTLVDVIAHVGRTGKCCLLKMKGSSSSGERRANRGMSTNSEVLVGTEHSRMDCEIRQTMSWVA
jgi:hypothetical protein